MEPPIENEKKITDHANNLGTSQVRPEISEEIQKDLDSYESIRKEFQDLKKDFITVFGIFASFVTFLSVEIQIFKIVTDFWLLLGLSSFLLASILLFSFSINALVKGGAEWKEFNKPIPVIVALFIIGAIICFALYTTEDKETNSRYYKTKDIYSYPK